MGAQVKPKTSLEVVMGKKNSAHEGNQTLVYQVTGLTFTIPSEKMPSTKIWSTPLRTNGKYKYHPLEQSVILNFIFMDFV
jgi:hypothetical protein